MGFNSKSPWLIHYDGSSCNGCDIEVLDSLMPLYDIERFGIINTGNPKHADIFLVTGSVNHQNINVVRHVYDQMLEPKVVVACGICACSGGIFRDCYNIIGGVDKAIPVDVYAPGCAVRPESIIDAVLKAVEILDEKARAMKAGLPMPRGTYHPFEEDEPEVRPDAERVAFDGAPTALAGAGWAAGASSGAPATGSEGEDEDAEDFEVPARTAGVPRGPKPYGGGPGPRPPARRRLDAPKASCAPESAAGKADSAFGATAAPAPDPSAPAGAGKEA